MRRPRAHSRCAWAAALALASVALALGGCAEPGRAADQPLVFAHPMTLDDAGTAGARLGPLRLEAAFVLGSADPRFGGLSGLWLAPDGTAMIAASDRGTLWQVGLMHDADGRLAGFADWRPLEPGRAPGDPSGRFDRDAEALAPLGPEALVIAYEGPNQLRRLALGALEARATALPILPGLEPSNAGIEALAPLADGALLALAEGQFTAQGDLAAWQVEGERALPLSYAASDGFAPTGADRLDDIVFVVERRFSLLGGFATRVVALPAAEVRPGARLIPRPLAVLRPPLVGENFEAIAARRAPDGRVLLYLLADDNFIALQRTLLLQLSLEAAWPRAHRRDRPDAGAGS